MSDVNNTRIRKTYSNIRRTPILIDVAAVAVVSDTSSNLPGLEFGGWSPVNRASNGTVNTSLVGGNYSTGREFFYDDFAIASGASITGVRFWWPANVGTKTIRCRIYENSGVDVIDTVNVNVLAAGIYSGTFATPILMDSTRVYKLLVAAIYVSTHNVSTTQFGAAAAAGGYPEQTNYVYSACHGIWLEKGRYGVGSAGNVDGDSGQPDAVEPLFDAVV